LARLAFSSVRKAHFRGVRALLFPWCSLRGAEHNDSKPTKCGSDYFLRFLILCTQSSKS
jgi:hypothetical protein